MLNSGFCRLLLLMLFFCNAVKAANVVRLGSYLHERSIGAAYVIKPWLRAVQADVGNQVRFDEYWGGTLGKSPHKQFELVRSGVLDVAWVLPGYTPGQFPEMGLFELPYLFESAEEASVTGWMLYERGYFSGLDGVRLLGIFATEPNALFMRQPILSVSGIRGQKVRSVGAIHSDWLREFGATAQTMNAVDMNQALDRDIIDGVIQGWSGMRTFDTYPLVSEAWSVPLGTTPFLVLMNEKTWNSLPFTVREAMMRHGGLNIARTAGRAYAEIGDQIRARLLAEDRLPIRAPDDEEASQIREGSLLVHKHWIAKLSAGQEIYDITIAILAQMRQEANGIAGE